MSKFVPDMFHLHWQMKTRKEEGKGVKALNLKPITSITFFFFFFKPPSSLTVQSSPPSPTPPLALWCRQVRHILTFLAYTAMNETCLTPTVQHQKHTMGIGVDDKIFIPFADACFFFLPSSSNSQMRSHSQSNLLKRTVQCCWPHNCFFFDEICKRIVTYSICACGHGSICSLWGWTFSLYVVNFSYGHFTANLLEFKVDVPWCS